jgi:uncharacterized membrane protein YphA (DoxX/SURF4 family)
MSTSAANRLPSVGAAPRKGLNLTLWIVQALLALVFLGAGSAKLIGKPDMIALFAAVGVGQWFRYVTGILEVAGAVLILVPKTRSVGAALLAVIMVCAIATNLFIVHAAITPPLVLLLLASFVVWGRRRELAFLRGQ